MFLQRWKQSAKKYLLTSALLIGIVILLLGVGVWTTRQLNSHGANSPTNRTKGVPTPVWTSTAQANNGSVSPLIFGSNMSLFDSHDQLLNSSMTRSQLQRMHLRIIRMPVRSQLANDTEILAAQAIKSIGALPLVVLRGAVDTSVLADDTRIIHDMNSVFGQSIVFYEYGNEEDLQGVDTSHYTASWNAVIPQLKRVALQGHFIGPVNFQYDQAYLTDFLQRAHPRPDEVSWHEYTCDVSSSSDACISHIEHWTSHIRSARRSMMTAIGRALPIMITEWNYAPNATRHDGKNDNSNFMANWTTKALETLAANRVFASMQYSCTNAAISLIASNNTLTIQGTTFQTLYQRIIVAGQLPSPVSNAGG